jgi:hypothetical protein
LYQTHSIKTNCITDFNGLYYSKEDHVHSLDDVCGLCDALDGKSDIDHLHDKRYYIRGVDIFEFDMQPHTHPITDVCRLCIELSCIDEKISGKADINHVHSTSEVVDLDNQLRCLTEALAGKSDIGHTHDNYPIGEHTHKLSDTCNLVNCLNNKACKNHKHKISDVSNLQTCLNNKSDVGHTHNFWYAHVHSIDEVSGLQTCLDNKACVDHTHDIDDVTNLQSCLDNKACVNHTHDWTGIDIDLSAYASLEYVESNYTSIEVFENHVHDNYALVDHKHNASEICWVNPHCGGGWEGTVADGLNDLWAIYQCNITHCHAISDVTCLENKLNCKADKSHCHCISNIKCLQTKLNCKADKTHTHCISNVKNLSTCLSGKAAKSHTHSISNITSLSSCLSGKAAKSHTHTISNITSLSTCLSNKAPKSHTHTGGEIIVTKDCGAGVTCICLTAAIDEIYCNISCINGSLYDLNYKLENHWHEFNPVTCQNEVKFPADINKSVGNTYTGLSTDYSSGSTQVFNGVGVYEINNNKPTKELIRIVAQMLPPETIQNIIKLENYSGGYYNPFVVKWLDTEEELQIPLLGGSVVAEYYLNPGDSISVNVKEPVGLGPDSSASPNITVYRYNMY